MSNQLIVNFKRQSHTAFLAQAQRIAAALAGNSDFPEPWPDPTPSVAQLNTALDTYERCVNQTLAGDRSNIPAREIAREQLTDILRSVALYLELAAKGDLSKLATTGYGLRKPRSRPMSSTLPLGAPEDFKLLRGDPSGVLIAKARALPGAAAYDLQITTADPTIETNWTRSGTYASCAHIELDGLTPGKVYSARIRGIGNAGPGAWAPAIGLMVV